MFLGKKGVSFYVSSSHFSSRKKNEKTQTLNSPKVVALGLHEVGGQALAAVGVEVGEGAGHARGGDAGLDGLFLNKKEGGGK